MEGAPGLRLEYSHQRVVRVYHDEVLQMELNLLTEPSVLRVAVEGLRMQCANTTEWQPRIHIEHGRGRIDLEVEAGLIARITVRQSSYNDLDANISEPRNALRNFLPMHCVADTQSVVTSEPVNMTEDGCRGEEGGISDEAVELMTTCECQHARAAPEQAPRRWCIEPISSSVVTYRKEDSIYQFVESQSYCFDLCVACDPGIPRVFNDTRIIDWSVDDDTYHVLYGKHGQSFSVSPSETDSLLILKVEKTAQCWYGSILRHITGCLPPFANRLLRTPHDTIIVSPAAVCLPFRSLTVILVDSWPVRHAQILHSADAADMRSEYTAQCRSYLCYLAGEPIRFSTMRGKVTGNLIHLCQVSTEDMTDMTELRIVHATAEGSNLCLRVTQGGHLVNYCLRLQLEPTLEMTCGWDEDIKKPASLKNDLVQQGFFTEPKIPSPSPVTTIQMSTIKLSQTQALSTSAEAQTLVALRLEASEYFKDTIIYDDVLEPTLRASECHEIAGIDYGWCITLESKTTVLCFASSDINKVAIGKSYLFLLRSDQEEPSATNLLNSILANPWIDESTFELDNYTLLFVDVAHTSILVQVTPNAINTLLVSEEIEGIESRSLNGDNLDGIKLAVKAVHSAGKFEIHYDDSSIEHYEVLSDGHIRSLAEPYVLPESFAWSEADSAVVERTEQGYIKWLADDIHAGEMIRIACMCGIDATERVAVLVDHRDNVHIYRLTGIGPRWEKVLLNTPLNLRAKFGRAYSLQINCSDQILQDYNVYILTINGLQAFIFVPSNSCWQVFDYGCASKLYLGRWMLDRKTGRIGVPLLKGEPLHEYKPEDERLVHRRRLVKQLALPDGEMTLQKDVLWKAVTAEGPGVVAVKEPFHFEANSRNEETHARLQAAKDYWRLAGGSCLQYYVVCSATEIVALNPFEQCGALHCAIDSDGELSQVLVGTAVVSPFDEYPAVGRVLLLSNENFQVIANSMTVVGGVTAIGDLRFCVEGQSKLLYWFAGGCRLYVREEGLKGGTFWTCLSPITHVAVMGDRHFVVSTMSHGIEFITLKLTQNRRNPASGSSQYLPLTMFQLGKSPLLRRHRLGPTLCGHLGKADHGFVLLAIQGARVFVYRYNSKADLLEEVKVVELECFVSGCFQLRHDLWLVTADGPGRRLTYDDLFLDAPR